ncbi:hypothetical protein PV325_008285 [Microctonus aethiopoides]|nr:hypothetical protein PV325_008285 [Microctonus aethiopoides]
MAVHATTRVQQKRSQDFLQYLNQFWGRIPETLSVVDHTSRWNYIAQRFNSELFVKLGGRRPPLYSFLKGMGAVVEESEGLWRQLIEGSMVVDQHQQKFNPEDQIQRHQRKLRLNDCTMGNFLTQIFPHHEVDVDIGLPTDAQIRAMEREDEVMLALLQDPVELPAADPAQHLDNLTQPLSPLLPTRSEQGGYSNAQVLPTKMQPRLDVPVDVTRYELCVVEGSYVFRRVSVVENDLKIINPPDLTKPDYDVKADV